MPTIATVRNAVAMDFCGRLPLGLGLSVCLMPCGAVAQDGSSTLLAAASLQSWPGLISRGLFQAHLREPQKTAPASARALEHLSN